MTKLLNLETATVSTTATAVLLPETCFDDDATEDRRVFCKMFLMNIRLKYFETAVENRNEYNSFVQLDGNISVGEKVSCGTSPEAHVTAIEDKGKRKRTVTLSLLPFGTEIKYKSLAGKVRQFEPDLTSYDWKTCLTLRLHTSSTPSRHFFGAMSQ